MKKGFSENKDVDRIILLKLSDRDLLETLRVNTYALNLANEHFWRNRIEQRYPQTMQYKKKEET